MSFFFFFFLDLLISLSLLREAAGPHTHPHRRRGDALQTRMRECWIDRMAFRTRYWRNKIAATPRKQLVGTPRFSAACRARLLFAAWHAAVRRTLPAPPPPCPGAHAFLAHARLRSGTTTFVSFTCPHERTQCLLPGGRSLFSIPRVTGLRQLHPQLPTRALCLHCYLTYLCLLTTVFTRARAHCRCVHCTPRARCTPFFPHLSSYLVAAFAHIAPYMGCCHDNQNRGGRDGGFGIIIILLICVNSVCMRSMAA